MPDPSLQQLLDELHRKLDSTPTLGDPERRSLEQLAADIGAALGRPGAVAAPRGVRTRLEAAATQFEGSHPELTVALMKVVQALGDMGI